MGDDKAEEQGKVFKHIQKKAKQLTSGKLLDNTGSPAGCSMTT